MRRHPPDEPAPLSDAQLSAVRGGLDAAGGAEVHPDVVRRQQYGCVEALGRIAVGNLLTTVTPMGRAAKVLSRGALFAYNAEDAGEHCPFIRKASDYLRDSRPPAFRGGVYR